MILDLMQEEKSEDVQELLEYPEQSAGRLMSPEVVAVHESATVDDAIQPIRKSVTEEKAFELYVVDDHRHLIGVVPLRRLLIADPKSRILAVRNEDVVSVTPETDREEVARVVAKYDLVSVPVVDAQHRLLGTIAVDDVIDILGEEASEDIFRIAGSDASELERRSPRQVALMRLPWVLTTLVIEMMAGLVIHYFDQTLAKVILLASFMPVIQAISGNTGVRHDGRSRTGDRPRAPRALVGAAPPADPDVEHHRRRLRGRGRHDRLAVALGRVRPGRRRLDVRLRQSFGGGRHRDPHDLQARGLRSRHDGRPVRDRASGRPGRHDLPVAGDRAPALARLSGHAGGSGIEYPSRGTHE
jgi:CBS-domain-containing membrane protein